MQSNEPTGDARFGSPSRLTTVATEFREGQRNDRLLFGHPAHTAVLESREGLTRGTAAFAAGARFALDLWRRNTYGTTQWRVFVCEAIDPPEEGEWVPCVTPAVRVLLASRGVAQSRLVLAWLRELEAEAVDVLTCPPERFEAAHFRLHGGRADVMPPRRLSGRV